MNKIYIVRRFCALFFLSNLLMSFCQADQPVYSAGALYGVSAANNSGGEDVAVGANFHARIFPHFGLGMSIAYSPLAYQTFNTDPTNPIDLTQHVFNINILHIDTNLIYHFPDILDGLWLGARLGVAAYSAKSKAGEGMVVDKTSSGFEWGPTLGYDYKLAQSFSIGVDLAYMQSSINTLNNTDLKALLAFAAFKYWF